MTPFEQAVDQYHDGNRAFVRGDGETVGRCYSQADDVVLCSPLRPFAVGSRDVVDELREAASHFADGTCEFERVSAVTSPEMAYIIEVERFTGKLDGTQATVVLRVTTVFRLEDSRWMVVHRHADPILTRSADGLTRT